MAKKGNRAKGLKLYGNTPNLLPRIPCSSNNSRYVRAAARIVLAVVAVVITIFILMVVDTAARAIARAIVDSSSEGINDAIPPASANVGTTSAQVEKTTLAPKARPTMYSSYDDPMSQFSRVPTAKAIPDETPDSTHSAVNFSDNSSDTLTSATSESYAATIESAEADPADAIPVTLTTENSEVASVPPIAFFGEYTEEEYYLAKIGDWEAGAYWLPEDAVWKVESVVLNHVDSPEFANTVKDVIFEPGKYGGVNSQEFAELIPSEKALRIARELLAGGERAFPRITIGQSELSCVSGPIRAKIEDPTGILETIYFWDSVNESAYTDASYT